MEQISAVTDAGPEHFRPDHVNTISDVTLHVNMPTLTAEE